MGRSFLLVSGLIPPRTLERAVDTMWRQMSAERRTSYSGPPLEPRDPPLRRDDPRTWTEDWLGMVVNPEILATFTPEYLHCAAVLAAANARSSLIPVAPHLASRPPPAAPKPTSADPDATWEAGTTTANGDSEAGVESGYPIALNYFPKPPLDEPQRFGPHCDCKSARPSDSLSVSMRKLTHKHWH